MRYLKGGAQTWGLNFGRIIRFRNERSLWSPIPRQFLLFRVSLAGTLTGFEAPSGKIFTVTPYVLGDVARDYTRESAASGDGTIGGEAKIGLTQSVTLDLTVNTDFAQVEVDDAQVNLTRFPLFFPEKRPFFLENAGSFSVGSPRSAELFFSRRIGLFEGESVPIQGGARLSGKMAGMQVGFLAIQSTHLDVFDDDVGEDVRVEPPNNFGVVRLFQEFENRTRVGGIMVSRVNTNDASDYNLTYAVDGTYGIGEAINLTGWAAGTTTPGVEWTAGNTGSISEARTILATGVCPRPIGKSERSSTPRSGSCPGETTATSTPVSSGITVFPTSNGSGSSGHTFRGNSSGTSRASPKRTPSISTATSSSRTAHSSSYQR